ncbi:MAG TPA: hypothetical protein VLZ83_14040 [Edaphocola sp.]|nr:hypothetical protein [Edaphocola sp.]
MYSYRMSNRAIANRIYNILSEKAAMGMGYEDLYEYEDDYETEIIGDGVRAGVRAGARRKSSDNPWVTFLKKYSASKGISYSDAMTSTAARNAYARSKKQVGASKKKSVKKKPMKRCPTGCVKKKPAGSKARSRR